MKNKKRRNRVKLFFFRFWDKVLLDDDSKCWEFTGNKLRGGYGGIRNREKNLQAHRVAWMLAYGEIPEGMLVCHKCDNPPCCNPSHLFLGTHKDNAKDKSEKHRCNCAGENNGRAKLNWEQVKEIRKLWDTSNYTKVRLGKLFGVSDVTIGMIINNEIWRIDNAHSMVV